MCRQSKLQRTSDCVMSTAAQKLRQRAIKTNLLVRCEWCRVCVWRSGDLANFYYIFLPWLGFYITLYSGLPRIGAISVCPSDQVWTAAVYCTITITITSIVTEQPSFICIYTSSETPHFCPLVQSASTPLKSCAIPRIIHKLPHLQFEALYESDEKNGAVEKLHGSYG